MTKTETHLLGLGKKEEPEIVALNRRLSFAKAIPDMGRAVNGYSRMAMIAISEDTPENKRAALKIMNAPNFPELVQELTGGLFAIRMFSTRANMERVAREAVNDPNPTEVEYFSAAAIERVASRKIRMFGDYEVMARPGAQKTINAFFQYAAQVGLEALQVNMLSSSKELPWDEAEFWADYFRGIADNEGCQHLAKGFSLVYLDHIEAYRKAVSDDAAATARADFRVM